MGLTLQETSVSLSLTTAREASGETLATQLSATAEVDRSTTKLDATTVGAIVGAVAQEAAGQPGQQAALLSEAFTDLGNTLAKGQGAYFISVQTPRGGVTLSATPSQLADILSGKTPSPIPPYSLSQTLNQALGSASQEEAQFDSALKQQAASIGSIGQADAQTALYIFQRDNKTFQIKDEAKFDLDANGNARLRLIQDQIPAEDGTGTIKLTVAYIPPEDTATDDVAVTQSVQTAQTLSVTA